MQTARDLDTAGSAASDPQAPLFLWQDAEGGLLASLADALRPVRVTTLQEAAQRLEEAPTARLLMVYTAPRTSLVRAMSEHRPPAKALQAWFESARAQRDLLRRARRRVLLVEAAQCRGHPQILLERLGAAQEPGLEAEAVAPEDPVLGLLADQALRENLAAQALAGELEASSLALSADLPPIVAGVDAAFAGYRQNLGQMQEVRQRSETLAAEHQIALEQLELGNAELERSHAKALELREEVDFLRAELQAARDESAARIEELRGCRRDLEMEHARRQLMEDQAGGAQAELARLFEETVNLRRQFSERTVQLRAAGEESDQRAAQNGDLKARVAQLEQGLVDRDRQIEALTADRRWLHDALIETQATINGIAASRSYRMMAPVRRMSALVRRKKSGG